MATTGQLVACHYLLGYNIQDKVLIKFSQSFSIASITGSAAKVEMLVRRSPGGNWESWTIARIEKKGSLR